MQSIFSLILLTSIIIIARSQEWTGTYTVQPGCDTTRCCCFNGQVTVTRYDANSLDVNTGHAGLCGGLISSVIRIPDPKSFIGQVTVVSAVYVTLSNDSRTITVTDRTDPACNVKAVKNGAVQQHLNIGILLMALILLQGIVKNFSKI